MTTTAATWFYHALEKRPYLLAERVRATFWDERFGGLWLDALQVEPHIVMAGVYAGAAVRLEWEPARWLRLISAPATPALADGLRRILHRAPTLRYEDSRGQTIWEWWLQDGDRRWQELQGKPAYRSPARLDREE